MKYYYAITAYDGFNKSAVVKIELENSDNRKVIYVSDDWNKVTFVLSFYHCFNNLISDIKDALNKLKYVLKSIFKLMFYMLFKNDLLKGK